MSVGSVVKNTVTASKTWILPPRPKPGRKSKKAPLDSDDIQDNRHDLYDVDDDNAPANAAGAKSASRTKQKASRERKQEYIAQLEAKVRQYEHGDGEKASLFQAIAKKYSAENDILKQQIEALKSQVEQLQGQSQPCTSCATPVAVPVSSLVRKASSASLSSVPSSQAKRAKKQSSHSRTGSKTPDAIYLPSSASIDLVKPSCNAAASTSYSTALAPPSHTAVTHASPAGSAASSMQSPLVEDHATTSSLTSLHTNDAITPHQHDCAMCDKASGGNCLCDDLGMNHDNLFVEQSLRLGGCGLCEGEHSMCICEDIGIGRPTFQEAPLFNPPIAATVPPAATLTNTTAVPLKLRNSSAISKRKIWHLEDSTKLSATSLLLGSSSLQHQSSGLSTGVTLRRQLIRSGSRLPCSGDPRNCAACSDDPAGQAFCSALSKTVCSTNPCKNCPNRPSPLTQELLQPSLTDITSLETRKERVSLRRRDSSARDEVPEAMIPCSDAWATLRAHPNIGFAKLDLLAAVVAKRTHCSGEITTGMEGKVVEVESQGVEEALNILDNIREVDEP